MLAVSEVLNAEIDLTDDNAQRKDKIVEKGKIEFKNVSFRFLQQNLSLLILFPYFLYNIGKKHF